MTSYGYNNINYNTTPQIANRVAVSDRSRAALAQLDPRTQKVYLDFVQRFGPTEILSGYREKKKNEQVGGAKRSQHMHRKAIDFAGASSWSQQQRAERLEFLANHEYVGGIGSYSTGAVHFDTRDRENGQLAIWGSDTTSKTAPNQLRSIVARAGTSSSKQFVYAGYKTIGERLMSDLQRDFGFTRAQASGIVGNLAHESGNFRQLQEINPIVPGSRGGAGYAQWTGPRRIEFENYARRNNLKLSSYEANYGNLKRELTQTNERGVVDRVRSTDNASEAALVFSNEFLRPGIPHNDRRISLANQYNEGTGVAKAEYRTITETITVPSDNWTPIEEAQVRNTGVLPTRTITRKVRVLETPDRTRSDDVYAGSSSYQNNTPTREFSDAGTSASGLSATLGSMLSSAANTNQSQLAASLTGNRSLFSNFRNNDQTPGEIEVG